MAITKVGNTYIDLRKLEDGVEVVVMGVAMTLTNEAFNEVIKLLQEAQSIFGLTPVQPACRQSTDSMWYRGITPAKQFEL